MRCDLKNLGRLFASDNSDSYLAKMLIFLQLSPMARSETVDNFRINFDLFDM